MTSPDRDLRTALTAAITVPIAMIAYQVAGKATRDALFLSTFGATKLPAAVLTSSLLAIVAVVICGRAMARYGPGRIMPPMFAISGGFLLLEWVLSMRYMAVSAAMVFVHFNVLGALLISGFWSMVNERFDPRTAKQQIGRIGAASTLGGLIGGVLAERVGAMVSITAMLPALALLHFFCSRAILGLRPHRPTAVTGAVPWNLTTESAVKLITQKSYLRSLVVLVVLATVSEGLLDYSFKARAADTAHDGEALIRLFAAFYTGVSVVTFLFQAGVSRLALEEMGLARTVAALPAAVAVGGIGALAVPGLVTTTIARGTDAVLRNSLYRSGYELLFTPIAPQNKRQTKSIIDVAFVRLGDALGAGLVQVALFAGLTAALPLLMAMTVILSIIAVTVALRLNRGYVAALEKSLLSRAVQLDLAEIADSTTRTAVFQTAGTVDFTRIGPLQTPVAPARPDGEPSPSVSMSGFAQLVSTPPAEEVPAARQSGVRAVPVDPDSHRLNELRSANSERVRSVLLGETQPARWMVAHIIPLLAWDAVAEDATRALRRAGIRSVGQMVDALLDAEEEFVIRRRIPAVLAWCPSDRTVQGLLQGLEDSRFEVRYRCGRALSRLDQEGHVHGLDADQIYEAVLREVGVDRGIWESQRLLDRADEDDGSPFVDEFLRQRASRSLEHVFTVLSLVLPAQPLTIAFRGLHTDDHLLRGTALEYLETSLPPQVREKLWPFLEDSRPQTGTVRPREAILADLVRSNQSIALNLEALRRKHAQRNNEEAAPAPSQTENGEKSR